MGEWIWKIKECGERKRGQGNGGIIVINLLTNIKEHVIETNGI